MSWKTISRAAIAGASFLAFLVGWEGIVRLGGYPHFILPAPGDVFRRLSALIAGGTLWRHAGVTVGEVIAGLALGTAVATVLGYLLSHSPLAERLLAPYIVASQAVPVVAVAPLLVIWFGTGLLSKVLISALIVFFPVLVNTIVGVRSVDPDLQDLMRSLKANRWQMLWILEIPSALRILMGGLRIGATLAVIGAVVGEFVASNQGLGYLIKQGQQLYDTPLVFVGIGALVVLAQTLYGVVVLAERLLLRRH